MLKNLAIVLAATGLLAGSAVLAQDSAETEAPMEEKSKGQIKLDKLLDGKEAGEPSRCIRTVGSGSLRIIDGTAIVYKRGDTVWVNRTRNPRHLDDSDVMVIRKFSGSQLCRLDTITTVDRYNQFYTGNIFLTDFVPYKTAEQTSES